MMQTAQVLPWLVLGGAVICAIMLVMWKEARTAGRILAQFFATIGLPILVFVGAAAWLFLPYLDGLDPRIAQALIAGFVISIGWLTTVIFAELGKARLRAEKLRDYHKAIYAEIGNTLESLWESSESDRYVDALTKRMKEDAAYIPFIPKELHDHVYNAVITEIDVLPRQTIDAIVAYYSLIKSLAALAEDMRGDTYKTLSSERRIAVYADYIGMRKQAFLFGKHALTLIRTYSQGGAAATQRIVDSRGVNTQDADPSAKLQGSV